MIALSVRAGAEGVTSPSPSPPLPCGCSRSGREVKVSECFGVCVCGGTPLNKKAGYGDRIRSFSTPPPSSPKDQAPELGH